MSSPLNGSPVFLALGGGGMRGAAHVGVIGELLQAGVAIRGAAGTSSGAMLGASCLLHGVPATIELLHEFGRSGLAESLPDVIGVVPGRGLGALVRRARQSAAILRAVFSGHPLSMDGLVARVAFFLPDIKLEEMPVPFVVCATDSATGEEVRLRRGSLRLAIAASSAMPGLVAPLPWEGRRLQDGGAVAEIPVGAARELGGPVVAVEVSEALPPGHPDEDRLPRALLRASAMGWQELRRRILAEADAVIAPAVNELHWADYRKVDESVAAGRDAAKRFLAQPPAGVRTRRASTAQT